MFVKDLLQQKGSGVHTIRPNDTVYRALELMAEKDVGALVVVEGDRVVGMFTERDYARKVILKGKNSRSITVGDLMVREVLYLNPSDQIEHCMALMTEKHLRHLPVLEEGKLVGLISIGDVVKSIIRHQEFTIQELERYITGA
ncbi:MAG: CBS domain-containing protein [Verrucomicrobiae bacterium]|nr:CBS domain-containing protein [Verrucomicrobiae bacterium]